MPLGQKPTSTKTTYCDDISDTGHGGGPCWLGASNVIVSEAVQAVMAVYPVTVVVVVIVNKRTKRAQNITCHFSQSTLRKTLPIDYQWRASFS